MKAKKSVKKARKKSTSQKATQELGQPGISMFRLDQLKAAKYNPGVIDSVALEGLTNSISRFGFVEPIVIYLFCRLLFSEKVSKASVRL